MKAVMSVGTVLSRRAADLQKADPVQLSLFHPVKVAVDGLRDGSVECIGDAFYNGRGRYKCLANVHGALCIIEVTITFNGDKP